MSRRFPYSQKLIYLLSVIVLCGLFLGCAHCPLQTAFSKAPSAKITPLPQEKTNPPLKVELPNGMTVILKENHDSPVVAMQAWFKTGSIYENEYLGSGITHAVEHMLFKNTKKRGIGVIAQEIHNAGGELNGYTTWDSIVFHLVVAGRYFDTGLDVLSDAVMNSAMDEGEWQKEQQVILREILMNEDDPSRYMYTKFWNLLYEKHPYRYPIIGNKELFSRLTIADVRNYYQTRFTPNNMIFVAVGDFNQDEVLQKIKLSFKDFAPKSQPDVYLTKEPQQLAPREFVMEKDVQVARLNIGYHTVDVRSQDMYPLDVMAMVMGQGRTSRLYQNVKEKGLVYSITSWSHTPLEPGIYGISAELEEKNIATVKQAILKEIARFEQESVTAEELQRAQQSVISQYYFSGQTVEGLAHELAGDYYTTGDLDFSKRYVEGIKKVTPAAIKEVARRYFYPENSTQVVMLPGKAKEEAIVAAKNAAGFSFKDNFTKATLKNGITLLVKENFTAPIVSVQTFALGGVRYEKATESGLANFMQSMLRRGTKNRDANKIAEELETMGAYLSTDSGYNSCTNKLSALSQDFAKGVDILADVVKNPVFPSAEMEKMRADVLAVIKKQDEDIFPVASKLYRETYFKDHPYRFRPIGIKETVAKFTPDDLAAFYKKIYNPQRLVIIVVGAVKASEAKEVIEKNFGSLPPQPVFDVTLAPPTPPTEAKEAVKYLPGKGQALLMLGFRGTDLKDPDVYVYEVMSAVLSGQGSRLFQELRDKKGLAYYVGTNHIVGIEAGSYLFYIGTTPDKVAESEAGFWTEIEKLKQEPIAEEELNRAKKSLIGQKEINLQTNDEQGFGAGLDEIYGLGYDNLDKYAATIEKVTAADIQRLAKQNFVREHSLRVLVEPPQKKE